MHAKLTKYIRLIENFYRIELSLKSNAKILMLINFDNIYTRPHK